MIDVPGRMLIQPNGSIQAAFGRCSPLTGGSDSRGTVKIDQTVLEARKLLKQETFVVCYY